MKPNNTCSFLGLFFCFSLILCTSSQACNEKDIKALLTLKDKITVSDLSKLLAPIWDISSDCCTKLSSVSCDFITGAVKLTTPRVAGNENGIIIDLSNLKKLKNDDIFPPSIGKLPNQTHIFVEVDHQLSSDPKRKISRHYDKLPFYMAMDVAKLMESIKGLNLPIDGIPRLTVALPDAPLLDLSLPFPQLRNDFQQKDKEKEKERKENDMNDARHKLYIDVLKTSVMIMIHQDILDPYEGQHIVMVARLTYENRLASIRPGDGGLMSVHSFVGPLLGLQFNEIKKKEAFRQNHKKGPITKFFLGKQFCARFGC